MKVIVAGFSKTGTKTLNFALTQLGYNVYDFMDHLHHHNKQWTKIFEEGGSIDDFKEMYEDVDAVVDLPAFLFWEEISNAFPEAKIVFTTRDEESWVESLKKQLEDSTKTINVFHYLGSKLSATGRDILRLFKVSVAFGFGQELKSNWSGLKPNKMLLLKRYRMHNTYFLENAPKDKTLVFNVKDGWDPLCKFLDKEVPDVPFPWRNKSGKEMSSIIENHAAWEQARKEVFIFLCCFVGVLGVLIYLCS